MSNFKLAAIGLDTSHTVAFTTLIQGQDTPAEQRISGLKVTRALRFPSAFQAEDGQNQRQAQMEALGVRMAESFDEAVKDADGILLELNDRAMHLEYVEKAVQTGLPVFLDKPLADSLESGKRIVELVKSRNIRFWSSSPCRFFQPLADAKAAVGDALFCNVFGALGKAAKGSDVIWYGVHVIEMINSLMGRGAESVTAQEDALGIVATIQYSGGRRAVAELNRNTGLYGGRVQNKNGCKFFINTDAPLPLYWYLMKQVKSFFLDGAQPIEIADSLESQAILDAVDRSRLDGKTVAVAAI